MKNKIIIGLVLVLGTAGYFGYDYYMTKIPVAVKLVRYTTISQKKEHYRLSQISGVSDRYLRLKDGTRSEYVAFYSFINREGRTMGREREKDLSLLVKYLED
jgi:hypothetical protein